jgi:ABC-type branched-subunit amino acid transport system substrate-binding protein
METIRILLLRPQSDDPSPVDQSLGARLSAQSFAADGIRIVEEGFNHNGVTGLERKLTPWQGKLSAVVGATNVPDSTRLGELAEGMNLLCFVANNNPAVWQGRRQVFHIGLPTNQTTTAVAGLVKKTGRRRILLLHDQTEFQSRVALSMESALSGLNLDARTQAASADDGFEFPKGWQPELIYVIFSSERKALPLAQAVSKSRFDVPLLFGRSLLRKSFLTALGDHAGDCWFVDMFQRNGVQTVAQRQFIEVMSAHGVDIPTANHAFGWDGMAHCATALKAAAGDPQRAIEYLETGVLLQGASGTCSFSRDNHNGRFEPGPHTLTRWHHHRLEDVEEK